MMLRWPNLMFFAIAFATNSATGQESFFFNDSFSIANPLRKIAVSEIQDKKLSALENRLNNDIERLEENLRTTQQKLRQQLFDRTSALDTALTPEQSKSLNEERRAETKQHAKEYVEFMEEFANYLEAVSAANALTIYEGLPRAPDAELEKIKNQNKTIEIDGWAFYAEPLPAKSSIIEKLRSSLVDYKTFEPYSGGKFCGGFHPDFCVEWKTGDKTYYVQICLGCFEAVFISPNGGTTFDFNDAAWKSFAQIAMTTFKRHADIIKKIDEMIGQ